MNFTHDTTCQNKNGNIKSCKCSELINNNSDFEHSKRTQTSHSWHIVLHLHYFLTPCFTLCANMNSTTLWTSQLSIVTLFQLLLTPPPPLLFITIQRIHAGASRRMLVACSVGAGLKRRKGNHRRVAVGATSRDVGAERENLAPHLATNTTQMSILTSHWTRCVLYFELNEKLLQYLRRIQFAPCTLQYCHNIVF